MAKIFPVFGLPLRNGTAQTGGMTTQPIVPTGDSASTPSTPSVSFRVTPSKGSRSGAEALLPSTPLGIPKSLNPVEISRLTSPISGKIPQIVLATPALLPQKKTYPIDVLSVGRQKLENGNFKPIAENGISVFRPEIISIVDFMPIWKPGALVAIKTSKFSKLYNSDVGNFINIQYQAGQLRQETVVKLVENIQRNTKKSTSDDKFNDIRNRYLSELHNIESNLSYFQDMLDNLNNIKLALDIKSIPKSMYNAATFLPLQEFFEKKMQYPASQFNSFSDTKILLQLLADFRAVTEGYSISLLDLIDPDRAKDFSPVKIDKTYNLADGFSFDIANLRSTSTSVNATEPSFFARFVNSLPPGSDERIRILTVLFSKEYQVSRGLGKQDVQRMLNGFGASAEGNPFDNIIGEVGNTIFEPPLGANSLSSLMFIDPKIPNAIVLPFESKYVDSDDQKFLYAPGSSYFADAVLSVNGGNWNTAPFINFVNLYNSRLRDVRTIYDNIFGLTAPVTSLGPRFINDSFLSSLRSATSGLVESSAINNDQAILAALFKLAATDTELKNMLFQYCILVGMSSNDTKDQKDVFGALANSELLTADQFSFLQVSKGTVVPTKRGIAVLRPYIEQLASAIETRVSILTTKSSVDISRLAHKDLFSGPRPASSSTISAHVDLLGSVSLLPKSSSTVSLHVQRGNVAKVLTSLIANRAVNASNTIKEFIDLAAKIFKDAQVQGANVHLLQDGTNRTRYNFLSVSTQLLMLFEIMCAYTSKYAMASFERSDSVMVSTITVDVYGQQIIKNSINQLIKYSTDLGIIGTAIVSTMKPLPPTTKETTLLGSTKRPSTKLASAPTDSTKSKVAQAPSTTNKLHKNVTDTLHKNPLFNDILAASPLAASDFAQVMASVDTALFSNAQTNKYVDLRNGLVINQRKILDETLIIGNCLHILTIIGTYLKNAADKIQNVFNQVTLQNFMRNEGPQNLSLLRNPAQLQTAKFLLQFYKEKTPATTASEGSGPVRNNLVISDTTTPEEYKTFVSLLSGKDFLTESNAEKRIRLLSVGVPAGFSQELADRVDLSQINQNTFKDKQSDVININVYRRDARFDDLALKPQRFIFDMSLFVLESDIVRISPSDGETFDKLIKRISITDMQDSTKLSVAGIGSSNKYDFLQPADKTSLISNHVISYLLSLYVNFMTGIRLAEDTFVQSDSLERTLDAQLQDMVISYLNSVKKERIPAGQGVKEILNNPRVSDDAKDTLRLLTQGSLVFNPGEVKARVLTPKLFDRVFHIPLNIDAFEVDMDLTTSTESGRLALKQSHVQEQLVTVNNKVFLKPRDKNDLILEDYFVAIETAKE